MFLCCIIDGRRPALGFVPHAGLPDVVELVSPWSPPPVGLFPVQDLCSVTAMSSC